MSKIKVSTLEGPALNDQVAKSLGWEQKLWGDTPVWFQAEGEKRFRCMVKDWKPSTDWAQGGPIIENEKISVIEQGFPSPWRAIKHVGVRGIVEYGGTSLIAAMRSFVASKFGEEVDE